MLTNKMNLGARVGIALATAALCAAPALGDSHFPKPRHATGDSDALARECEQAGHQVVELSQRFFGSEVCSTNLRACRFAPDINKNPAWTPRTTRGCVFDWETYAAQNPSMRFGHMFLGKNCQEKNLVSGDELNWNTCAVSVGHCPEPFVRRIGGVGGEATESRFAPCIRDDPGAVLNARDSRGRTPLMLAILRDDLDETKSLLDRGANARLKDRRGWTAMHYAVSSREISEQLVRALLEADPEQDLSVESRRYSETPLHILAGRPDNLEALKMLLEAGADVTVKNRRQRTPLHLAQAHGNTKAILLIAKHAGY